MNLTSIDQLNQVDRQLKVAPEEMGVRYWLATFYPVLPRPMLFGSGATDWMTMATVRRQQHLREQQR